MSERARGMLRLTLAVVIAGVAVGVMSGLLNELLRLIETLAFGAPDDAAHEGAALASGWRRLASLTVVGVVGAVAWFALRRWGRPIVSVEAAVGPAPRTRFPGSSDAALPGNRVLDEGRTGERAGAGDAADGDAGRAEGDDAPPRMPWPETLGNALVQLAVVGGGASVGREAAPRELGALIGQHSAGLLRLGRRESRVLVAAAAGAGLAGVYGVPVSGAFFALEVLGLGASIGGVVCALAMSLIAAGVEWVIAPHGPLYLMPPTAWSWWLVLLAIPLGAAAGLLGRGFARAVDAASRRRPRGTRLLWVMPAVFVAFGLVSFRLPWLLGNGRSAVQFALNVGIGPEPGLTRSFSWFVFEPAPGIRPELALAGLVIVIALLLLVLKLASTVATIGSGVAGGTLTPSLAIGALLGLAVGAIWLSVQPDAPLAACALAGAGAVLAASTRAPFMAFALAVELTHANLAAVVPLALAVAASWAVARALRPAPAVEDID